MKSQRIKSELVQLEQALRDKMYKIGVVESAKMSGQKQPDVSAWLNNKRNWTYNKILEIAEKLGL
jgi:predicted glycosyl hydrolase (DUF1957 family)